MNKKQIKTLYNTGNLQDGFNVLYQEVKNDFSYKSSIIDNDEEIAYADLRDKFAKKREELEKKEQAMYEELKEYLKTVEKYSTFPIEPMSYECIMDILTDIISLYKGQEYEWDFIKKSNGTLDYLMAYPRLMNIEDVENVDNLINDGIVFDFDSDYSGDEEINFYEAYTDGSISETNFIHFKLSDNSKKHAFILEFIDLVVKYRMEKKSDDISFVELKRLEQAFIYSKKEEIDALNRKRSQDEREELEKKIEERDALLDKYIDDNFDVIDEFPSEVALGDVTSAKVLRKLIETYNETCE